MEGDGRQGFGFSFNLDALFCLDGLVQALVVAAALHQTAGELVDDDDLAVLDDVVDVAGHHAARLDGLVDVVLDRDILGIHEVVNIKIALGFFHAVGRKRGGLCLFIHDVIGLRALVLVFLLVKFGDFLHGQPARKAVADDIHLGGLLARAGDNQRGSRLVDQDRVDLVDDGKVVHVALHLVLFINHHVVAQVVEAKLVVGAVCDVAVIGFPALFVVEVVHNQADLEAQEPVDLTHPLGVAARKVVVDRDDMHAFSAQRVEIGRKRRHEGFTLTGAHFRNTALMQHNTADDLHREVLHAEHAPGRLSTGGKRLRQNIVERFSVCKALLELGRAGLEFLVAHGGVLLFQRQDRFENGVDALELALAVRAK